MGRRAADVTTPIPVLGVPALVGVRAWKTRGDKSTRGLLQTWGLQCSVGVQTSPGISRPPTALPDTLSESITQMTNGCITKETEIYQQTRRDGEKKAILKQKTGEIKIKKEVTFKACGGDASEDVTCSQKSSGETYCYARAIKTHPLSITRERPKFKSAARYTNGSVVDSEAIGGISVANDEPEPENREVSNGTVVTHQYEDQSVKSLQLSNAKSFTVPQKICKHCGESQAANSRSTVSEGNNLQEIPQKPPLASPVTNDLCDALDSEKNQQICQSLLNTVRKIQVTGDPQTLDLNDELRFKRSPHLACPVHSRSNLANFSRGHVPFHIKSPPLVSSLHANSPAQNTAESRQKESIIKLFTKSSPNTKHNRPTSLALNSPIATAIKSNNPYSQTHPRQMTRNTFTQGSVFHKASVSVHSAPENMPHSFAYSLARGAGSISTADTLSKKVHTVREVTKVNSQQKRFDSLYRALKGKPNTMPDGVKVVPKRPASLTSNVTSVIHKAESFKNPFPANPTPDVHKTQEKALTFGFDSGVETSGSPVFVNTLLDTENSELNADQTQRLSTKHKSDAAEIHLSQPNYSTSSPSSTCTLPSTTPNSTTEKHPNSTLTCIRKLYQNTIEKSSPSCKKKQNISVTRKTLFQPQEHWNDSTIQTNEAHRTQTIDTKIHITQKSNSLDFVSDQDKNMSRPLVISESQNLLENYQTGNDGCGHKNDDKSAIYINDKLSSDENNFREELVIHESRHRENVHFSQVTGSPNYILLIRTSSSCLRGCLNKNQQMLTHCQGYRGANQDGHNAMSPPVKASCTADSITQHYASSASSGHAHTNLKSNSNGQAHCNYSSPSDSTQTTSRPIISHMNTQVKPISKSSACQNSDFDQTPITQKLSSPKHSVIEPASFNSQGDRPAQAEPKWDSVCLSSTMHLPSGFPFRSSEVESNIGPDSKFNLSPSGMFFEDTNVAHSHPVRATLLLPTSPQWCKSVALQQRLEAVEASLAANEERITTLLNIICDLETCCTSNKHSQSHKTGQDLKSCLTCQKTACIVYSVEYDFRQQERRFLDVLNGSANDDKAFSAPVAQPLNLSMLRKIISKNLTKTKLKSKKLCKILLKWLPRKSQQI